MMTGPSADEQLALDYLSTELGDDAPETLVEVGQFDENVLENEGPVTIFTFSVSLGGNPEGLFFVVAGQTGPNYYPACDFCADQMYSLHLGTRFMLVMEIQRLDLEKLAPSLESEISEALGRIAPREVISEFRPVAAFTLEGQKHAVCRLRIANEEVYVLGGDLPLGVYREIGLPPHVVYRLHLGQIIRMEKSN